MARGSQSIRLRHAPWPFSRWQRQRSGTAESRRLCLTILNLAERSGAMIGMAGKDGRSAIDLLGQARCGRARAARSLARATAFERAARAPPSPSPSAPPTKKATPGRRRRDTCRDAGELVAGERFAPGVEANQFVGGWHAWRAAPWLRRQCARCGRCGLGLRHLDHRRAATDGACGRPFRRGRDSARKDRVRGPASACRRQQSGAAWRDLSQAAWQSWIRSPSAPSGDRRTTSSRDYRTRAPLGGRYGR